MNSARELFFLLLFLGVCAPSFFMNAAVVVKSEVETLLKHAELELNNPLLFQDGIADLALVFRHKGYIENPLLEKKLISLLGYAQRHVSGHSIESFMFLKTLSEEVFAQYAGTRYALELSTFLLKSESHNYPCQDKKSNVLKKENSHSEKEQFNGSKGLLKYNDAGKNQLVPFFSSPSIRRSRVKKVAVKKVSTPRVKKTRAKRLTKKEKEAAILLAPSVCLDQAESQNMQSNLLQDAIGNMNDLPVERKKRTSKKKEPVDFLDEQLTEKPVKKRASRKKVVISVDESDKPVPSPKKRAPRKKKEKDLVEM